MKVNHLIAAAVTIFLLGLDVLELETLILRASQRAIKKLLVVMPQSPP